MPYPPRRKSRPWSCMAAISSLDSRSSPSIFLASSLSTSCASTDSVAVVSASRLTLFCHISDRRWSLTTTRSCFEYSSPKKASANLTAGSQEPTWLIRIQAPNQSLRRFRHSTSSLPRRPLMAMRAADLNGRISFLLDSLLTTSFQHPLQQSEAD